MPEGSRPAHQPRHPGSSRRRGRTVPKGRQVFPSAQNDIRDLLGDAPRRRDLLIEFLHLIQDAYGHISAKHLMALAEEMKMAQAEVYEVATFYAHFDVVKEGEAPPPPVTVRVCENLSCNLAGAEKLIADLNATTGSDVRVARAPCMGHCHTAPVAEVGHYFVDKADAATVNKAVADHRHDPVIPVYKDLDAYRADGGYETLKRLRSGALSREQLVDIVDKAGLRGCGGAGFPTARKWKSVLGEKGPRLMAVNADEGEPGTFKDRYFLETDPHRVLEGMLMGAHLVGATDVYFYLRDEYPECREILTREIDKLETAGLLAGTRVWLRRGAGAYICGEESAMIESIEGKRGMPRLRPPYVAQVGLFGRPTLEHNMETLFWVRDILDKGGAWFAAHGANGRKGLRSFSVSGRVKHPGVKLAPAGITIQELIDEYCGGMADGHSFYAYLPGGASGGILPASMNAIPLDFDTLQPHGCFIGSAAVVVLSDRDSAMDAARNLMRFFKDESCGQCTPCRVGTAKALALVEQPVWDVPLLADLSQLMRDASICGLGQAAPNPVDCVVRYFPHELTGA